MFKKFCILISCCLVSISIANAHDKVRSITSIYWSDGDSGWINGKYTGYAFRLANVDAAPLGKCAGADIVGYKAKEYMVDATQEVTKVQISKYYYHDDYKRHVVDLSVSGRDLGRRAVKGNIIASWRFRGRKPIQKRPIWC